MKPSFALSILLSGMLLAGGAHAAAADHVTASHAWVRILPGALPAGAYVTLQNHADEAVLLNGASSTRYAEVALHQSSRAGGVARMSAVDTLPLPANGTAELGPGGYHLMLMKAVSPVQPGDTVTVVLRFSDGSELPVDFLARPANALDAGEDHSDHAGHTMDHGTGDRPQH